MDNTKGLTPSELLDLYFNFIKSDNGAVYYVLDKRQTYNATTINLMRLWGEPAKESTEIIKGNRYCGGTNFMGSGEPAEKHTPFSIKLWGCD